MDDLFGSLSNVSPLRDTIQRALERRSGGIKNPALKDLLLNVAGYLVEQHELPSETVDHYVEYDGQRALAGSSATSMYASSIYSDDSNVSVGSSNVSTSSTSSDLKEVLQLQDTRSRKEKNSKLQRPISNELHALLEAIPLEFAKLSIS